VHFLLHCDKIIQTKIIQTRRLANILHVQRRKDGETRGVLGGPFRLAALMRFARAVL
jgi:hypothetical protein